MKWILLSLAQKRLAQLLANTITEDIREARALNGSKSPEGITGIYTTAGRTPDLEDFSHAKVHSPYSPLDNTGTLNNADFDFDASDWLLDIDVFNLLDFRGPQSDSLDGHFGQMNDTSPQVRDLRDVWYIPLAKPGIETGVGANVTSSKQANDLQDDIDEAYRADMATKLLPSIRDDPLPSVDLLVSNNQWTDPTMKAYKIAECLYSSLFQPSQCCASTYSRADIPSNFKQHPISAVNMLSWNLGDGIE